MSAPVPLDNRNIRAYNAEHMIAETLQHTQHTTRRELVESFRLMVLEKTDNGSLIIEFLISAVNGELEDFKPCHKLEAARLLEKFTGVQAQSLINGLDLQPATRRERRDGRRADRRISSEIAQIAQERTNNGGTIVEFLVSAMEGKLQDFKPCHRMSASRELLRCLFDFIEEDDDASSTSPEPVEGPEEEEERLRREEYERRRADAIEFSLHGPVYYEVYPFPCVCEDRRHDCKGNELTDEEISEVEMEAPGYDIFIHDPDRQAAFKARYEAYLTRLNPGMDIDFSRIRWRKLTRDP